MAQAQVSLEQGKQRCQDDPASKIQIKQPTKKEQRDQREWGGATMMLAIR